MLLRRVSKHVYEHNWFAVGLDFVIVIIGVFIGIQVSNWNQDRIDMQDASVFLENLHKDVEIVQNLGSRLLKLRTENFTRLGELVDVVTGQVPKRAFTIDDCLTLASSDVFYIGRSDLPALIQLRNSGRTNIITDHRLQAALARLVQKRESLEIVISSASEKVWDFRRMLGPGDLMTSLMIPDISRPGEFERTLKFESCNAEKLLNRPEVRNGLVVNIEFYDAFMRDGLVPWTAQVDEVHKRIDRLLRINHKTL